MIIASVVAPTYAGGLAAYSRRLGESLGLAGLGGVFSSVFTKHPSLPEVTASLGTLLPIGNPKIWRLLLKPLLSRLAARPAAHPLLERLLRVAIPNPFPRASRWAAIHYVGTGWDFLGFRLRQVARDRGVRFTVWPAVHPNAWGDDNVDIRLYKKSDTVFCQSEHERTHLARLGVPEGTLVRCGLPPMCRPDGDRVRLRSNLGIHERPTVLFVGRRSASKGYEALLKAWPLVVKACPDAVLLLAGPGDRDENRLSKISVAGVRDLGIPNEETKADALASCDVFCLPSAQESFGIVYIEAWSYGKPVICGTAPACRELVADGVTGLWADQNPNTLAEEITLLLSDRAMREKLGNEGRNLQRLRYTAEAMVQVHLQAFGLS